MEAVWVNFWIRQDELGRKLFLGFSLGKNILVSLNYSNKSGAFDLNVNGSICKKKLFWDYEITFYCLIWVNIFNSDKLVIYSSS